MRRALLLIVLTSIASGCRKNRLTPEQQVRKAIADVEKAVEDKDSDGISAFVSEKYSDPEQRDRRTVRGLMRLQFLRYPTIHLLVRVSAVDFPVPGQARATVFAAMGSLPIGGAADIPRVTADVYRFDLDLAEEDKGRWKVTGAKWSRARPDDFL